MSDAETDATFAEMTEGLVITTDTPVIDYTTMPLVELSNLYSKVKQELLRRGEMLTQETEHGKDLGAIYHGCLFELKRRGIL